MQKSGDGGGNNANKIFTSRVEEGYIPNTISYVELFTNTLKIRNNFCNWYYYKMHKSRDGGENNVYKVIMCWVEERNVLFKRKTCLKLFIASMKKKQFSELSRKVNSMKPKSQDRRGNNVNRTKKCKNRDCKEVSFNSKRSSLSILKWPRKINNQWELVAGVSLKHITVVPKKFVSKYCSAGFIQWWPVKAYKLSIESYSLETLLNSLSRQITIVQINKK